MRYTTTDGPNKTLSAIHDGAQGAKMGNAGNTPPPGYHAQLGLLYAQIGKGDRVVQEFQTEKTLFPESAIYMDFLLKKQKK